MTTLAVDTSYLVDGTNADAADVEIPINDLTTHLENVLDGDQGFEQINLGSSDEITISSGAVTVTRTHHRIDTEGNAASDDLETINGGAQGDVLYIRLENAARTVTFKHNTGNIYIPSGLDYALTDANIAIELFFTGAKWVVSVPISSAGGGHIVNGRLTLAAGEAVPDFDIGISLTPSTLYFLPYKGNVIRLYTGTEWVYKTFTSISAAIPSTRLTTYDVFVYDNSGTLALEFVAWVLAGNGSITSISNAAPRVVTVASHTLTTGDLVYIAGNTVAANDGLWRVGATTATTFALLNSDGTNSAAPGSVGTGGTWQRADEYTARFALGTQDGVYVKSGDPTRLWLGTMRTTVNSGQSEDSRTKRFVANYYNPVPRVVQLRNSSITFTWTYATASYRVWDNELGHRVEVVVANSELPPRLDTLLVADDRTLATGLGIDDKTTNSSAYTGQIGAATDVQLPAHNIYEQHLSAGYHAIWPLENSTLAVAYTARSGGIIGHVWG